MVSKVLCQPWKIVEGVAVALRDTPSLATLSGPRAGLSQARGDSAGSRTVKLVAARPMEV